MSRKLLPIAIIIASLLVAVGLVKFRRPAEQSDTAPPVVFVDVIHAAPRDVTITVNSQGSVEPRTRTTLISEVSGQVVETSPAFVAGGFFRQGDVLLRLNDQDYRAAVTRARFSVASARSQLAQEEGQAQVAQREWERMTPERQAQIREKDLYLRKPQLEEARANLVAAEADLEQTQSDLAKTTITAPYDGLISSKNTDIGQFVNTGATLAEIFAVDYAEVRLPIPESKIALLELPAVGGNSPGGMKQRPEVELTSQVGNRVHRWSGHLTRTEGVLDTTTRVLFSVVQVQDPYALNAKGWREPLRVGTYVNAAIQGKLLPNVTVLPRHTLQANDVVWVVDSENSLRARAVEVAAVNGDDAYISSGLQPGDRVVITRLENPLNGTRVQTNRLPSQTLETLE